MSGKMIETGSQVARLSRRGLLGAIAVAGICAMRPAAASAQLVESFEGTLDGWTFNPTYNTQQYTQTFSTTTGVTNGSESLEIDSGATARVLNGFDYGNLLIGPRTVGLAALLATTPNAAVAMDVFAPSGALGYGPQIDMDLDDGGSPAFNGYQSIDNPPYSYPTPTNGTEVTMVFPLTTTEQAAMAADVAGGYGANLVIQAGSGTPTGASIPVLYIDNIRVVSVPEPASLGLLALGATGLLARRRKA